MKNEPGTQGRSEWQHHSPLDDGICDLVNWPVFTFPFIILNYIAIISSSSKHISLGRAILSFSVFIICSVIVVDSF